MTKLVLRILQDYMPMLDTYMTNIYHFQMSDPILKTCEGFDWDPGNFEKSQKKHGVSRYECEQLFFNEPFLLYSDEKHSQAESRYFALGQTDEQRKLMLVFTIRENLIRVISARPMSRKERGVYEKAEKNPEI